MKMRAFPIVIIILLSLTLSSCSWGLYPLTCPPTWFTNCGNRPEGGKEKKERKEGKGHEPEESKIESKKIPD